MYHNLVNVRHFDPSAMSLGHLPHKISQSTVAYFLDELPCSVQNYVPSLFIGAMFPLILAAKLADVDVKIGGV